ncbi:hypothetical protein CLOP_g22270 [Closterium sp. NIES-67]|nr:hypothetical protein CLOP_g22270 [Closterium sp. NIES-67]
MHQVRSQQPPPHSTAMASKALMMDNDVLSGAQDPRLRLRLLQSLLTSFLPVTPKDPIDMGRVRGAVGMLREQHVLAVEPDWSAVGSGNDPRRKAVDAWCSRVFALLASPLPANRWAACVLAGATCAESTPQRVVDTYAKWWGRLAALLKVNKTKGGGGGAGKGEQQQQQEEGKEEGEEEEEEEGEEEGKEGKEGRGDGRGKGKGKGKERASGKGKEQSAQQDTMFVRVAAAAALADLFSRLATLSHVQSVRKEAGTLAGKLWPFLAEMMGGSESTQAWSVCLSLLSLLLRSFPSSFKHHVPAIESLLVAKLASPNAPPSIVHSCCNLLVLLPRASGDPSLWSAFMRRLLLSVHADLDTLLSGFEDASVRSKALATLLHSNSASLPTPLVPEHRHWIAAHCTKEAEGQQQQQQQDTGGQGHSVGQSANPNAASSSNSGDGGSSSSSGDPEAVFRRVVPRLHALLLTCQLAITQGFSAPVPAPLSALLSLAHRLLSADATIRLTQVEGTGLVIPLSLLASGTGGRGGGVGGGGGDGRGGARSDGLDSMGSAFSAGRQLALCVELPALQCAGLRMMLAVLQGVRNHILPHAATISHTLVSAFRRSAAAGDDATTLPFKALLYRTATQYLYTLGAGMMTQIAPIVVGRGITDLKQAVPALFSPTNQRSPGGSMAFDAAPNAAGGSGRVGGGGGGGAGGGASGAGVISGSQCLQSADLQIAILEALEALLVAGGPLLPEHWRMEVDAALTCTAAIALGTGGYDSGFNSGYNSGYNSTSHAQMPWTPASDRAIRSLQLAACHALLASLLAPCKYRPPTSAKHLESSGRGGSRWLLKWLLSAPLLFWL